MRQKCFSLERKGHEISFLPCLDVTLPSTYVLTLLLNESVLLQKRVNVCIYSFFSKRICRHNFHPLACLQFFNLLVLSNVALTGIQVYPVSAPPPYAQSAFCSQWRHVSSSFLCSSFLGIKHCLEDSSKRNKIQKKESCLLRKCAVWNMELRQ